MFCIFFPCKTIHNSGNRVKQIHIIRSESNTISLYYKSDFCLYTYFNNPIMQYMQQLLIIHLWLIIQPVPHYCRTMIIKNKTWKPSKNGVKMVYCINFICTNIIINNRMPLTAWHSRRRIDSTEYYMLSNYSYCY